MWSFAGSLCCAAFEGFEDGAELAVLLRGGLAEGLCGGSLGRAEVAVAAGAKAVGGVAEVLDEGGHAALRSFGEGDHAVDLAAAEGELRVVAGAPVGLAGRADVACHVERCRTLGGELFGGAVEGLGVHPEALAKQVGHLEVVVEGGGEAG